MASTNGETTYSLEGHKVLLILSFPIPKPWIDDLKVKYTGLKVEWVIWDGFRKRGLPPNLSDDDWKKVTILITGYDYPEPEMVPNLKLIQLVTAGSNYLVPQRSKSFHSTSMVCESPHSDCLQSLRTRRFQFAEQMVCTRKSPALALWVCDGD